MQIAYCGNCDKHTGHKRSIGAGTLLGAVVTGGVSLLAVPAYGKRCIICGLTEEQVTEIASAQVPSTGLKSVEKLAIAVSIILFVTVVILVR